MIDSHPKPSSVLKVRILDTGYALEVNNPEENEQFSDDFGISLDIESDVIAWEKLVEWFLIDEIILDEGERVDRYTTLKPHELTDLIAMAFMDDAHNEYFWDLLNKCNLTTYLPAS